MNIKILDSWLKDYLKTNATAPQIAEKLSLSSVSVERIEQYKNDFLYDIEVTTNRMDLASAVGLAREAAAILPQSGIPATFFPPQLNKPKKQQRLKNNLPLFIDDKNNLVPRICAVVMEVNGKESPGYIKDRLESSGIRSLNNLIDITNYVMRTLGHPTHVFDYDRIGGKTLIIREAKKGERIKTLDNKEYLLPGGDIIAEDKEGKIVDLLGIMGLENSVVTASTKRIIFFVNTDDAIKIRKTSMILGIRTEAAQLNEKDLDPELAMNALLYGIFLYQELADGKVASQIIDIYPNKTKEKMLTVSSKKIHTLIGVPIPLQQSKEILTSLGFKTHITQSALEVIVPTFRVKDIKIEEDIIEEIARIYGYLNIPSLLPPLSEKETFCLTNQFYWEERTKQALKFWGFTEVYTYSMVSEDMFEGPISDGVTIQNPLGEEYTYMRRTLIPSLLKVVEENKKRETICIFEIANVYFKKDNALPLEKRHLAGVVKKPHASFFAVKGLIEQLAYDLGIKQVVFTQQTKGSVGTEIYINKKFIGEIEILDENLINFELDFLTLIEFATLGKKYTSLSKYPSLIEDMAIIASEEVTTGQLVDAIRKQHHLIIDVSLFDKYKSTRTFRIKYQDPTKNLSSADILPIREKILKALHEKYHAKLKE